MLTISSELASERTSDRARAVLRRLQEFEDVPETAQVLSDFGHLLAA